MPKTPAISSTAPTTINVAPKGPTNGVNAMMSPTSNAMRAAKARTPAIAKNVAALR